MLDVVQFPQTFNPSELQILTDAFVKVADQLRYGPGDHGKRDQLAKIILRLARLEGVNQYHLERDAVAILTSGLPLPALAQAKLR